MPDGESQQPGGWNRVVLNVADLPAQIDALKNAGVTFRNQMEAVPARRARPGEGDRQGRALQAR